MSVFGLPHQKSFLTNLWGRQEKEHCRKLINLFGAVGSDKEEFDGICGIVVNSHGTMCSGVKKQSSTTDRN